MMGKFGFLIGVGVGYVLGARSGRERYDQMARKAQEVWAGSGAQERVAEAGAKAAEQVGLREPSAPTGSAFAQGDGPLSGRTPSDDQSRSEGHR